MLLTPVTSGREPDVTMVQGADCAIRPSRRDRAPGISTASSPYSLGRRPSVSRTSVWVDGLSAVRVLALLRRKIAAVTRHPLFQGTLLGGSRDGYWYRISFLSANKCSDATHNPSSPFPGPTAGWYLWSSVRGKSWG